MSVTGGLGGVGSEVVTSILESGGDVICLDLPKDPNFAMNTEKYHDVAKANGTQYSHWPVNVTDEKEVSETILLATKTLRFPLRGVVTCAGISGETDAIAYPPSAFRKFLDVNIMGTFLVFQAAALIIHQQMSSGSIVLISSISGHVSNEGINTAAYNASKSAVLQLARSLAAEWGTLENDASIRVIR